MIILEDIPMEVRNKALREAISTTPLSVLTTVLDGCSMTADEKTSLLEHRSGADLIWISGKLHLSDRSTDRRRASALNKLRAELEK